MSNVWDYEVEWSGGESVQVDAWVEKQVYTYKALEVRCQSGGVEGNPEIKLMKV